MSIEAQLSELTAAIRDNTASNERMSNAIDKFIAVADRFTAPVAGDAAAADAEPAPKPKTKAKGRPTDTVVGVTKTVEPIGNEPAGKTDGDAPPSEAVDMQDFRASVRQELLAYRDAVRDGEPASADPGDAVKAGVAAARHLLTPFKAAKFDDVKDEDLTQLRANIKAAHDALTAEPADAGSDIDLDI